MATRKRKPAKVVVKGSRSPRRLSLVTGHVDPLCEFVAMGGTLVDYCRVNQVSARTVNDYLLQHAEAAAAYARARETQADQIACDMLRLADACTEDDVQSTRAKIDTRKWLLSRWHRKSYGDHQKVEHEGQMNITVVTGVPQSKNLERVAEEERNNVSRDK